MPIHSRMILTIATSMIASFPALAGPFSPEKAPGRLPKNVVPISYAINIVPHVAARTFSGSERVVLDVRSATDSIQFNSLNETLHGVRLDGRPVKRVASNDELQLTTVT